MPKFSQQQIADGFELQQLVADYCHALDIADWDNITRFFTEDCDVDLGRIAYKGHAGMNAFYEGLVESERDHGHRTTRHAYSNFRVSFKSNGSATVQFLVINFSGAGEAPLLNATTPTVVTDVRFECVVADGEWLVAGFYGGPIFVGNDPVQNKAMIGDD